MEGFWCPYASGDCAKLLLRPIRANKISVKSEISGWKGSGAPTRPTIAPNCFSGPIRANKISVKSEISGWKGSGAPTRPAIAPNCFSGPVRANKISVKSEISGWKGSGAPTRPAIAPNCFPGPVGAKSAKKNSGSDVIFLMTSFFVMTSFPVRPFSLGPFWRALLDLRVREKAVTVVPSPPVDHLGIFTGPTGDFAGPTWGSERSVGCQR